MDNTLKSSNQQLYDDEKRSSFDPADLTFEGDTVFSVTEDENAYRNHLWKKLYPNICLTEMYFKSGNTNLAQCLYRDIDDIKIQRFYTWSPRPTSIKNSTVRKRPFVPEETNYYGIPIDQLSGGLKSYALKHLKEAEKYPRRKSSRAVMNGYECDCCKDFYDAMGLEGEERKEYIRKNSKHRGWRKRSPSPDRYWDLDVPSKEDIKRLGYVIDTDEPLIKSGANARRMDELNRGIKYRLS